MKTIQQVASLLLIISLISLTSCNSQEMKVPTVDHVDLEKYQGRWYEIARMGVWQERNLVNVTANYTMLDNGKIKVVNAGYKHKPDGKYKSVTGKAWRPDENVQGALKVRFFRLFTGDYYVVELDPEYQYALVGGKNFGYLWLLAREPQIPDAVYEDYMLRAKKHGFDISEVEIVLQEW